MLLAAFSPFFITSQSRKRLWYGKSGYAYYASLLHVAARGQRNNTGFCFWCSVRCGLQIQQIHNLISPSNIGAVTAWALGALLHARAFLKHDVLGLRTYDHDAQHASCT